MKRKYQFVSPFIALLLISTVLVNVGIAAPPPPPPPPPTLPSIYVVPAAIVDPGMEPNDIFTVDIMVTEVFEIYGWGFYLYFKPSVLQALTIEHGDFFEPDTWFWNWKISNANGYVTGAANFDPLMPMWLDGSGTLATITFKVVGVGLTLLDLRNTKLNTIIGGVVVPIEHTADDGLFDNRIANTPPTASFMVTPPIGAESDTITFDASASSDDGWIAAYEWNFGDRTVGSGKIVQHTYPTAGTHIITLTVTDNEGGTDSAQYTLEILPWMDGGHFPDLVEEMAWPEASVNPNEDKSFNEKQLGEWLTLWARVGNPTEETFEVRVDFKIYSNEGKSLGTVSSEVVTIGPNEIINVPGYFYLADPRWRDYPYWRQKYYAIAYAFHSTPGGGMASGRFPGEFWFRINAEDHDRAILAMTATTPVETGQIVTIDLTIENQGWADETATMTLLVDAVVISSQEVTIAVREQKTVTMYWDTTGVTPDSYYLEVMLSPHPFERDTADNLAATIVTVTAPPPP